MPLHSRLSSLWRNLFHKTRKAQELTEEIDAYLEMLIDLKIKEGLNSEDARRAALIELGGLEQVKESVREVKMGYQLETLWQDLRYALRMLLKRRVMTLIATITLALGIGANTAIFSVVNVVLLNAVPYYDPQRLLWVTEGHPGQKSDGSWIRHYLAWQAQSQAFEHLVAFERGGLDLTGRGAPERLECLEVTTNVFPALGLAPQVGRAFTPEEDRPEAARVALLGHAFWRQRFGGDPGVIGQELTLGGQSRTVIGVMPPRSRTLIGRSLEAVDVWLPLAIDAQQELTSRNVRFLSVVGRLKPGFMPEQAQAEANLILRRFAEANPGIQPTEARATLLGEALVGNLRRGLLALFGAVTLVLLIACANVANLLLGRAALRQKEMAIRAAMGAGRLRLVRQMLTESLLLSLLGGATGLLLAVWGVKALVAGAPPELHQIRESSVDGAALGFTFLASLLTGLVAGLLPALQSSQIDLNEALKEGARKGAILRRRWPGLISPALLIGEVALTLVALTGAGLLVNSYLRVLAVEPGYYPKNLLSLLVRRDQAQYPPDSPQAKAFNQEILTRVKSIPGVKAAAITMGAGVPLTGTGGKTVLTIEGRAPAHAADRPVVQDSSVSPDFFRAMGMQLRAGRSFTEQDDDKAPRVVIINETMARRHFPNENPIGQHLRFENDVSEIVGVVADLKRLGLETEALPEMYRPFAQLDIDPGVIFLAVRTTGAPLDLVPALRQQIYELGVKEPISRVMAVEQLVAESLAPRRFQMLLFGVFAAVALLLAAVGVYGVISYSVSRRTREIGIRMALGARRRDVLWLIVRQGMTLALAGVSIGLAGALGVMRALKGLLFELSVTDPLTFALTAALMLGVTFLACYAPARRATKVDPITALRSE
ncbi:MAG TPA: ABC transporter permease [Blastocatellia bacterium]|nr:ABC transporter permease [Blastocatellia bacterium]